jgi:branched-chain amino acid transport system ATP-binding protein
MSDVLAISGLRAGYVAGADALRGVDLRVGPGELVALLGANGAGKSTLLRCCSGLLPVRAGTVRLLGEDITGRPAHGLVSRGLVHVPEGRRIFPRLTVDENLALGAWTRRDRSGIAADLDRIYALFPILAERRRQAGGTLSGGEQQMLAIGRALLSRPRMLLLDEPSLGIAPRLVQRILQAISSLNRDGLAILLVEQNAEAALAIAHRGVVLDTGGIALAGPAAELRQHPAVRAAYLGG